MSYVYVASAIMLLLPRICIYAESLFDPFLSSSIALLLLPPFISPAQLLYLDKRQLRQYCNLADDC